MKKWGVLVVSLLMMGGGAVLFYQAIQMEDRVEGRWYTTQQVAQGAKLYQTHCAACHGPEAASTSAWRTPGADGYYPPPPLNGSAHAWHHPLSQLRRTVREGGIALGGVMPPFQDVLDAQQIDAILAWIQSLWSALIYQQWEARNEQ